MKLQDYVERRQQGEWLTLPSGLEVRVKPVDTMVLLRDANYPEPLMEIIGRHVYGDGKTQDEYTKEILAGGAKKMQKSAIENRQWAEILAENTIIEPLVTRDGHTDPVKGVIALSDLETTDCYFLANLINLPLSQLKTFCQEQNKVMERVLNGESAVSESEPAPATEKDDSLGDAADFDLSALSVGGETNHHQRVVDDLPV